ncbi:phosphoglycerate mutase [Variovorax terrae]|uniref:Phosphoglycerate mutase n=1 Tax=Variovorax terrae TaxID=2923278 RepID=A0A9X1VZZ8_9BURK|nr:phosphoglycerate mutase [Variovorax terrae]MCJ0765284.1 phosphoglycerate mutase [Variovorax terrae]
MHLLIPFASGSAPACQQALRSLALPHLDRLLARLTPAAADAGDDYTLSPPHERALARALGLVAGDGQIPWAAWQAGADAGDQAWAWITPCHWRVGTEQISMGDPEALQLQEAESQALLAAMQPFFEEDGVALAYRQPTRWLARGEVFRGLPTASLDRVMGRPIDLWMPKLPQARALRRLQNEMQMLLYTHAVNDAREQRGLLPVNSFWVSGTGALQQPPRPGPGPTVPQSLAQAALREDWAAWTQAWQQLDATQGAALLAALDRGEAVTLTLCGERSAQAFETVARGLWQRISSHFGRTSARTVLEAL